MRVIDYFDRGAMLNPDRACLVLGDVARTYAQVQRRTHQIANALIREGLSTSDKVAVLSPNDLAAFECVLGTFRAECVWSPVNARNSAIENAQILDLFDIDLLFWHSSTREQVTLFRERCPRIRKYICIDRPEDGSAYLEEWVSHDDAPAPERDKGPDELAVLPSTGGTTGLPKGVMWSGRTFQALVSNFHAAYPHRKPAIHLAAAPMSHAAGPRSLVMMAIGATTVILPAFDAEEVMKAIERHRVTNLFLPPTAIYMMLAHPAVRNYDYSSLEYFTYSAAPMSVDKVREAVDVFGPVMSSGFGQVESPSTVTAFPPCNHFAGDPPVLARLGSCGRPTMFTRVEIMDDEGRLVSQGQAGEIVVKGPLVMMGYYKNPEATAAVSHFGWHHTGDIGYKDADGFVYISDRKKDMIISGGFNVYSTEVEQVIMRNPAVQDCAVIGVPDEKWGEAVKAVVQLKPGATLTAEQLLLDARASLGGVKTPKTVEFWPSLPRSPAGKVSKKDIRDRFWEGRAKRI